MCVCVCIIHTDAFSLSVCPEPVLGNARGISHIHTWAAGFVPIYMSKISPG